MHYEKPITELVKRRFSCRSYAQRPIEGEKRQELQSFLAQLQAGPLGTQVRLELVAATEQSRQDLRGLGTYGFIKGATGFVVGAMGNGGKNLEDFGYQMEHAILFATDIGLGTCWLGGSFTKSSFAAKIEANGDEQVPAVASVGYVASRPREVDHLFRRSVRAAKRYPSETMFFEGTFGNPLTQHAAGPYATPLEMVRLGPSASNKQPWRIIKDDGAYHFYLQRTRGYRRRWTMRLLRIADMQRLDMGIAMCHFELTANELGLSGEWTVDEPEIEKPDEAIEYTVSWKT